MRLLSQIVTSPLMVGGRAIASIVARRLNESQKRNLLDGYRSGELTTSLAEAYGCSQNTVIRTVKGLLSSEEYKVLKAARLKGEVIIRSELVGNSDLINPKQSDSAKGLVNKEKTLELKCNDLDKSSKQLKSSLQPDNAVKDARALGLNDSGDFENNSNETPNRLNRLDSQVEDFQSEDVFHEIVPLASDFDVIEPKEVECENLAPGVLPGVVYMLVDRSVELDARPLREFPELGSLPKVEQERQALCLFSNQRSAKRNCGRSQRVIKVPDTNVFGISTPFLLARGITRLILEGSLIALDGES